MDADMCPECRKHTEVVNDGAAVDRACSECGYVLASWAVGEKLKRLNFSNEPTGSVWEGLTTRP